MSRDSVGPKMCIIMQISHAFVLTTHISCLIISTYHLTLSCLMLIRNTFVNTLGVTVDLSTWNSFCLVHLPVSLVVHSSLWTELSIFWLNHWAFITFKIRNRLSWQSLIVHVHLSLWALIICALYIWWEHFTQIPNFGFKTLITWKLQTWNLLWTFI